ncbi:hypothetical protein QE381_002389 [Microbacterium sp. SORGH_AS 888]|nr:hypothetical protein [Microbacterium sp. SORGH_AS_0888]
MVQTTVDQSGAGDEFGYPLDQSGAGDEFGYPLDTTADRRFHSPIELPPTASPADHERHAAAYEACQKRFSDSSRARRRPSGEDTTASPDADA